MDYKKFIKDRETRLAILRFLSFVPDRIMLSWQYQIKFGRKLDLKSPKRYSEKLQWYKLNYRDPAMIQCVDKYDVRQYVEKKGLGHILNVCYGVYDTPEQIDFAALPDQFVLKDTLGSGGDSVIIVKEKKNMDLDAVKLQLKKWIETPGNIRDGGREWPYYCGKKHRIIAEKYIESNAGEGGLVDYKFFCFHGQPRYLYVIADRKLGEGAGLGIFDINYHRLPYIRADEKPLQRTINKPDNYDELISLAKVLSADFPHVRVDVYDQDNKVVFGEMTFFDGSGYMRFDPDEFDYILGDCFDLSKA